MYLGGTVLTHLAISTSRGVLLASAGETGKPGHVRAYTYPLTGESDEYPCLGSPITAIRYVLYVRRVLFTIKLLHKCFSVHYLCLRGWIYVFYVGHIDKIMKPFSML
jgi:hypothetical protein